MSKFAGDDYSAMQGPCPGGFHVPNYDNFEDLFSIMTSLGLNTGPDYKQYLLMPITVGQLNPSSGNRDGTSSAGYLAANIVDNDQYNRVYSSLITSTDAYRPTMSYRAAGKIVRPFKDTPAIPDGSWTTLYQGTGDAGIYHNSTLGLISLSSDGNTWITIADKNLGATSTDTSSTDSYGNYYQRGNNYGFPSSGFTKSTTQVNASSYGPGNYYSSSTFITQSGIPYCWDSSNNADLWGGETGVVQSTGEPKKIYIRVEAHPITTAGIYHNSDLGLISLSSDGSNWITIADKNLGATTVYNSGDTLSEANCGKYYQWGNNYGFAWTGSVTTSSTKVDASTYGPGNYYSSSTFILAQTGNTYWDSSNNANLRGEITGTNEAMKGPCDIGFHIPTHNEWGTIYNIWTSLGGGSSDSTNFGIALKMLFCGTRDAFDASVTNQGSVANYWSSTTYDSGRSYRFSLFSTSMNPDAYYYRTGGFSIRPFKNEAVQPDDSRTKLY